MEFCGFPLQMQQKLKEVSGYNTKYAHSFSHLQSHLLNGSVPPVTVTVHTYSNFMSQ